MAGLSNFEGAPDAPRRREEGEPLHSLEPDADLAADWEKVRARLQEACGEFLWQIWLMHPQAVHRSGHTIYIEAPERMFGMISDRYSSHILLAAREVLDPRVSLEVVRHGWRPEGAPAEQPAGKKLAEKLENEPAPAEAKGWGERSRERQHGEDAPWTAEVGDAAREGKMAAARKRQAAEQADALADKVEEVLEGAVDEMVASVAPAPRRRRSDVARGS